MHAAILPTAAVSAKQWTIGDVLTTNRPPDRRAGMASRNAVFTPEPFKLEPCPQGLDCCGAIRSMDASEWRRMVAVIVQQLADRAYQERAWLGRDAALCSSPAEMCCALCDDLNFSDSLTKFGWTADQTEAGQDLVSAIDACAVANRPLHPTEVIDHPEWVRVRDSARRLADLL